LLSFFSVKFLIKNYKSFRSFHIDKGVHSQKHQGPHQLEVISIIIGTLLGEGHLEKRAGGVGTLWIYEQSSRNVEYLIWFHKFFAERGYCSKDTPKLSKRIKKDNKVFFSYLFTTYTFSSLN
jgi:ubiquinol-cytochrome c reductase cytochrome b subunit